MPSEAAIQSAAIAYAKSLGGEAIRMHFGRGVSSGWPDVLFLFPCVYRWDIGGPFMPEHKGNVFAMHIPRVLWIEFKSPGKKPSALQLHKIKHLRELGQDVHVCDSIDSAREILARAMGTTSVPGKSGRVPIAAKRGGVVPRPGAWENVNHIGRVRLASERQPSAEDVGSGAPARASDDLVKRGKEVDAVSPSAVIGAPRAKQKAAAQRRRRHLAD